MTRVADILRAAADWIDNLREKTPHEKEIENQWMETYTGHKFYFNNFSEDDFFIDDIAIPLSRQCRYNGHTSGHISVAHHSLLMADWIRDQGYSPRICLQALLHDATEAYISDMIRPLKPRFPGFTALEKSIWKVIAKKFDIPEKMHPIVKEADTRILVDERAEFMTNGTDNDWGLNGVHPLGVQFDKWVTTEQVAAWFVDSFYFYHREAKHCP